MINYVYVVYLCCANGWAIVLSNLYLALRGHARLYLSSTVYNFVHCLLLFNVKIVNTVILGYVVLHCIVVG